MSIKSCHLCQHHGVCQVRNRASDIIHDLCHSTGLAALGLTYEVESNMRQAFLDRLYADCAQSCKSWSPPADQPKKNPTSEERQFPDRNIQTDGGPWATHDVECPVIPGQPAVLDMNSWIFHPSWAAQAQGWMLIRARGWRAWLIKFLSDDLDKSRPSLW